MKLKILLLSITALTMGLIVVFVLVRPEPTSAPTLPGPQISSTPSSESSPTPISKPEISLLFGGDIMLGRQVEVNMKRFGASWPLTKLRETLKAADFTIANLESPFSSTGSTTPINSLILRGYPEGITTLTDADIDLVSLANNHITDMGVDGLRETRQLLDQDDILHLGAGEDVEEAARPLITEVKGVEIGFLSYSYGVNIEKAGIFYGKASPTRVEADVKALKPQVDVVVVLCHCGNEYMPEPHTGQITFSHTAIDAGATLVICHHPHVPQPVEQYRDGLIIYSLGNLVFDQQPGGNRDVSALASITLENNKLKSFSLLPYKIHNYGQPALIENQSEKERVWQLFKLPTGSLIF